MSAFLTSSRRGTCRGRAHLETQCPMTCHPRGQGVTESHLPPHLHPCACQWGRPSQLLGKWGCEQMYVSDLGNSQELFC